MRWEKCVFSLLSALTLLGLGAVEGISHDWMAPKEAAEVKNPIVLDVESARQGKHIYLENCADCHGKNIEGMKAEEVGLEMDTPNLKKRLKTHTDGDFFWKIDEGRGDMPSFKDQLSDEQIWNIINYIRQEP